MRLLVTTALLVSLAAAINQAVSYEAFAIRFGVLPAFRVSGLVAGAAADRTLDIPVMVWLLKGSNGRTVLVDSGFYRQKFVDRWKVRDFRSPADAVAAAGVQPDAVTDVIITHAHWDHVDGADLFPKATIWIQREEYRCTGEASAREEHARRHRRGRHAGARHDQPAGSASLRRGRRSGACPGNPVLYGRAAHACISVSRRGRPAERRSSRRTHVSVENLDKRVPIAQTWDPESNLKAQDRIRGLATNPRLIVPGHDPAIFGTLSAVTEGIVRIQ
jgi:glyoxylase-like metal-dependent hydrolase (beta-lactamase superfamily II)